MHAPYAVPAAASSCPACACMRLHAELIGQGHLRPESMLWAEGRSEWLALSAIEELTLLAEQAKAAVELEAAGMRKAPLRQVPMEAPCPMCK